MRAVGGKGERNATNSEKTEVCAFVFGMTSIFRTVSRKHSKIPQRWEPAYPGERQLM